MSFPGAPETASAAYAQATRAHDAEDWAAVRDLLAPWRDQLDGPAVELLGWACFREGDDIAGEADADQALRANARSIRASLLKADILSARALHREANVYYRAVFELGSNRSDLPADLRDGVRRAGEIRARLAKDIFSYLQQDLERAGYTDNESSRRFTHALDLARGKRSAYVQQPRNFYFPELPNIQFYPRAMFPWLDALEAATDEITAELETVLSRNAAFSPYLKTLPHLPSQLDYPLVDSMDWSTSFLWKDGAPTAVAADCPRTMALLEQAPLCRIPGRSPTAMFSQLKAGAHIRPHSGAVNTRLICHLPLVVPPNCQFRVGNEVRTWEKGKAWVFDDTIEHEAINRSDRSRVVLIFDIWRPELTEEERGLVSTLLESLDSYSPNRGVWE